MLVVVPAAAVKIEVRIRCRYPVAGAGGGTSLLVGDGERAEGRARREVAHEWVARCRHVEEGGDVRDCQGGLRDEWIRDAVCPAVLCCCRSEERRVGKEC